MKSKSHEWFKEKVHNYHGNKVELLSEYTGSDKPIKIIYHCGQHGDTETIINAKNICKEFSLPCKECQSNNKKMAYMNRKSMGQEDFYNRLVSYCNARGGSVLEKEWITAKSQYHFKCSNPDHPVFITTADTLYSGKHWCPYCSGRCGDYQAELMTLCHEKNGELLGEYKNVFENVPVKCNIHNYTWMITPANLKKGRWCPVCNLKFNEKVVWDFLSQHHPNIVVQYSFPDLIGEDGNKLRYDFAVKQDGIEKPVLLIEVDDEEHRDDHTGTSERQLSRMKSQERDLVKDNYCLQNQIPLYRMQVPFRAFQKWDYNQYFKYISDTLTPILKKYITVGGVSGA